MGIGDASIVAAKTGAQSMKFQVTLSAKASSTVSVVYTVSPDTATYSKKLTGGGDYGGVITKTLTFAVGRSGFTPVVKTISIPIWPDANQDTNESFTVSLSGLTGTGVALIGDHATGTILTS